MPGPPGRTRKRLGMRLASVHLRKYGASRHHRRAYPSVKLLPTQYPDVPNQQPAFMRTFNYITWHVMGGGFILLGIAGAVGLIKLK